VYFLAIFAEQGNVLAVDASAAVVFLTALILVGILNALLFKPINQTLEERDQRTTGYQLEAKAMLAECGHKLTQCEKQIQLTRAETYEMLEQRRKASLELRSKAIEDAKKAVSSQIAEARQQIQQQVAEAKPQLLAESRSIAERIASGIVGRSIEEVKQPS
jgi:F-type H+-transporting ATPase subunit b